MTKKYILKKSGDGHSPHVLENADDTTDAMYLCSCGGTSDPTGCCDGTHNKKKDANCNCQFCKEKKTE